MSAAELSAAALARLRVALQARRDVSRASWSGGHLMLELDHVEPARDAYQKQVGALTVVVMEALGDELRGVSLGCAPSEMFERMPEWHGPAVIYTRDSAA